MKKFLLLPILCTLMLSGCSRSEPDNGKLKVACVGDSLTYGLSIENREESSYPAVLGALLGESYEVRNYGASGYAAQKNAHLPYWNHEYYTESLQSEPNIVLIMLGTNDSVPTDWSGLEAFLGDYFELASSYAELSSDPEIWVMTPPSVFNEGVYLQSYFDEIENNITKISQGISDSAPEYGFGLIDIYELTSGRPELFQSDGVHINSEGARVIAREVYEALK